MPKPELSYTIWFSQRTGSTLLSKVLEQTDIAGKPKEWLNYPNLTSILNHYKVSHITNLRKKLWELGTTSNGVFGLKASYVEPKFSEIFTALDSAFGNGLKSATRLTLWNELFPNCRHIFMTRRNKVRLAVSWWKAIQTEHWHREHNSTSSVSTVEGSYSFDAIKHLYQESIMREAGIQELFTEANIVPLTITYEDFIMEYENTIKNVLSFIDVKNEYPNIKPPFYEKLADSVTEEWVQQFRFDLQKDWDNKGW